MNWTSEAGRICYQRAHDAYRNGLCVVAMEHLQRCIAACIAAEELHAAWLLQGAVALQLGRFDDAKTCFARLTQAAPSAEAYRGLSAAHVRLGEFALAAAHARAGLALLTPAHASFLRVSLLYNLGFALQSDDRLDEAERAYRSVLELQPDHFAALENLAVILKFQGALDEAIALTRHTLASNPHTNVSRANLADMLLAAGRYEEAWPHFEFRLENAQDEYGRLLIPPPAMHLRRWEGETSEAGTRRLLILFEQGFGDVLQFCRYLPLALERVAEVGFVCPAPLLRLFDQSFVARHPGLILLTEEPADLSDWDASIWLMSLPKVFRTTVETVPARVPYLYADPLAARRFADRLDAIDATDAIEAIEATSASHAQVPPRIGLVWAGGLAGIGTDQWRSIPTEQIEPLIRWPYARWISLQKPENESKALRPAQREYIIDWMNETTDFADTAALIECLDLVIAVDTSVAHLAGAMGKPVWLLNRFSGCWRWLHGHDDSPWYPGMRIFTQQARGNWQDVLNRVMAELDSKWRNPAS